jgi:hypothetical protein
MAGGKNRQRAAMQNATVAYVNELEKVKPLDQLKNSPTNNARKLKDSGVDSYRAIRLALQADKLARSSNVDVPKSNKEIEKFNDRVGLLGRQMAGERILTGSSMVESNPFPWTQRAAGVGMSGNQSAPRSLFGEPAETFIQVDHYLEPVDHYLEPIAKHYDSYNAAEGAYTDISGLSKNVESATANIQENSKQYELIAEKIKTQMRRDEKVNPAGLLSQEVLTGTPYSEVIR